MRLTQPVESCAIPKSAPLEFVCHYVISNADDCEGAGYLQWTRYVMCQEHVPLKVVLVVVAIIWLALLFISISVGAEDFFSVNVSTISTHMRMSESLAGATLVGFANGSPDVFSSIASVLSSGNPKTGLALGFLLGGVLYVSLMVFSAIILVKPFRATRRPMTRDLVFLLIASLLVLFFFLYDDHLHFWEPLMLVILYVCYVGTAVVGTIWSSRRPKVSTKEPKEPAVTIAEAGLARLEPEKLTTVASFSSVATVSTTDMLTVPQPLADDSSASFDDNEEEEDVQVVHNHVVISGKEARRKLLLRVARKRITSVGEFFKEMLVNLKPFTLEELQKARWFVKPFLVARALPMICMKATVPVTEHGWSKPTFLLQVLTAPTFIVFALQQLNWQFVKHGPGFFVFPLTASLVVVLILLFFTSSDEEPGWFRPVTPFLGFLMSISWIYAIAGEVVSVITMLGVLTGIELEILGATIIAWSNCGGDLFSDMAIAKQGYPRMAASAAMGSPMFMLLIGFGVPFTIAAAREPSRSLPLEFSPVSMWLVSFLIAGLSFFLITSIALRFRLRRALACILMSIYVVFIVLIVLTQTRVLKF